jgi:glycosyltransferase involved in cell wall biosynthesis
LKDRAGLRALARADGRRVRVTAFTKYGPLAASTRQRVVQYLPALEAAGFDVQVRPLLNDDYVASLTTGRKFSKLEIARTYLRRMYQLIADDRSDIAWVYAELFPYLPATFERLALLGGRLVVYDFDDAFHIPYAESGNPIVRWSLSGKLRPLMAKASLICAGNRFLHDYASQMNARTMLLPTVVDTDVYKPGPSGRGAPQLVIGWIGSPSTWGNVEPLLPLLEQLCSEGKVRFRAIGAGHAAAGIRFPGFEPLPWDQRTEIDLVRTMDIGIMPLLDRPFERGKSGYKLIQYMACGVATVASPVGANCDIVIPGKTGLLASSLDDWQLSLNGLISDPDLRKAFGAAGRERAVNSYSLHVHAPRLVQAMHSLSSDGACPNQAEASAPETRP